MPQNSYNSNIEEYWLHITVKNNNKKTWDIAKITKVWQRDMKWANAVRQMASAGFFEKIIYFFNWRIIALQNFIVFYQTSTWTSRLS